ncbi:tumor necrosis factor receptor superfamily member 13B isoform X2 [Haemorhous mexicanus]|uniref:tumor necrosis factor receptor superfamily member 13B isoform X2 n=1 Tax=Haemorhous mexicanus TaxID=30427 RepID=UPI0028BE84FF|nr:tumor necrosis factor receptor superfamily member 13B isoform X2 [Haemorhous mexicanus]
MDGPRAGQDAMKNCTDQEYWDTLVSQCIPCSLACRQSLARKCDAVCESMDCNKRPGFYYDDLVKTCIRCSSVCGQHPRECAPSCEPTPAAVLEQKACAEQEPWLALWLLLGLCLCSLVCSLLLGWTHLRRRGEPGSCQPSAGTCHCREDPAKELCSLLAGNRTHPTVSLHGCTTLCFQSFLQMPPPNRPSCADRKCTSK